MIRFVNKSFLIFLLTISGCSSIRISEIQSTPDDWTMYGGNIGRWNYSNNIIHPPLDSIWEYDALSGFSSSSASIADDYLFVGNLRGEVNVIRTNDGKGVGVRKFGSAIVGTPIVDNNMLYVALAHDDNGFTAYNLKTASVEWKINLGDIESSPLLLNKYLLVTSLDGKLYCIDKVNGKIIWKFELPLNLRTRQIHSSPASDGKFIVFGSDNGDLYAVDIASGKLQWKAGARSSIFSSPAVRNEKVFVGSLDSTFYAFDIKTGKKIWTQALGTKIYSPQAVNQKYIYVGTVGRIIYCLDVQDGTIIWKANTNGTITSAPFIADSIVYVGSTDKNLYAFNADNGELLWKRQISGRIRTSPICYKNYLFLFTEDRTVIAFTQQKGR